MSKYELWNRQDAINGVEASVILAKPPFKKYKGDIILIYDDSGRVINIECKDILAANHGLDKSLPLSEFMFLYFCSLKGVE